MGLLQKTNFLTVLISFGLLVSGCGDVSEIEEQLEITEGSTQVMITLHSKLELDFSIDPGPELEVSQAGKREFKGSDNKFNEEVYPKLRKNTILREQSVNKPTFKADTEYQALQRYENIDPERYTITIKKSPQKPLTRKTVKVQDKPLIFAGRGYNISSFKKDTKPMIDVDYATHLVAVPSLPRNKYVLERLDPKAEYSRDTKYLVYNSTRSAFGKFPPPFLESKTEFSLKVEPAISPNRNPDSVLLFPSGKNSLLVLRKAEKHFDLLAGNESLNKKQFRDSKIPEDNKKTFHTPQ
jgi:hypothetical protein